MARLTGAGRSGLGDGLRAVLAGAKGIGGRDAAHRGSNRAVRMCRGVDIEVRRRRARRSSGTGRCRGQSRGQRARGSSWSHSNAPASACSSRGAAWARASARREVAAWPSAGFGLSGRWGELGLVVERARPSAGPCGREKRAGPRGERERAGLGWCGFWVVMGLGLSCHLGSWAGWVLGFSNPFLFLFPFLFPTKQT